MTAPQPRPGIMDIAPYVGGEAKLAGITEIARLASNESPLGPSPRAMATYQKLASDLHRYPDGNAIELREALGRRYGLDPARIVCSAGSDEMIALVTRAYAGPGDEVLYSKHGFLMYAISAKSAGATPVAAPEVDLTADVDSLLAAVTPRTRIVFLANPNNPTGTYLPTDTVRRLRERLRPDVLLVIDAAYAEYVARNDYSPGIELVDAGDNTIMMRTFSKIFGLAALRLGWAYCPPGIADVINRVRGPFNVGAPAQAAGVAALEDQAHIDAARAHNDVWMPWLSQQLRDLGLTVTPSVGNFILVRFPDEAARNADAAEARLKANGILVRKMGGYHLPHSLRITVGLESECRRVVDALAGLMKR
jgi:histidinol-phosphate aminotransferase